MVVQEDGSEREETINEATNLLKVQHAVPGSGPSMNDTLSSH